MKVLLTIFGSLTALSGCFQRSGEVATDKRPGDFSVEYHWGVGMVPRPNYFEYY